MELSAIRAEIDKIDNELLKLFLQRLELGIEAGNEKKALGIPLLDAERERQVLSEIAQKSGALSGYCTDLFAEVIRLCREYQISSQSGKLRTLTEPSTGIYNVFDRIPGNIIIIGMPGSGKSSIAKRISEKTGMQFVNIDDEIVRAAGKSIPDIFSQDGEPAFRAIERDETKRAAALNGAVIATGGGVVKDIRNYEPLHKNGRIYFLRRKLEVLEMEGRPLSKSLEALKQMEIVREPMYRFFSDYEIQNNVTLDDAADSILAEYINHTVAENKH